jgi:hypothetical protein
MAQPAFVVLRARGATIPAEPSEHRFAPRAASRSSTTHSPRRAFTDTRGTGRRSYKPISFPGKAVVDAVSGLF